MKERIIRTIKIFFVIYIIMLFLIAFFNTIGQTTISAILWFTMLLITLFLIGTAITNRGVRKKYIIYTGIIVAVVIILYALGNIFGFSPHISSEKENTTLDAIATSIFLGTFSGILFKIVHDCKKKYPLIRLLYLFAIPWSIATIITLILTLFGYFN